MAKTATPEKERLESVKVRMWKDTRDKFTSLLTGHGYKTLTGLFDEAAELLLKQYAKKNTEARKES